MSDYPVIHFTDSTRTHSESGAADGSLCLKPAQFALVTAISIGPIHHEANRFALRPGQTIRGAQIGNRMLKSDSGRMHRPHKAMPGYHSVAYPTENRRTSHSPYTPRPQGPPKPTRSTDQTGNRPPNPESVHGTVMRRDTSARQPTHRQHQNRGIPTILAPGGKQPPPTILQTSPAPRTKTEINRRTRNQSTRHHRTRASGSSGIIDHTRQTGEFQ